MKHVVYRLFFVWDFEREQRWLNEMAAKGMMLTDVGWFRYVFQEGTPGEYEYQLEWLPNYPTHPESIAYIQFVEETGAEYVGSFKKWVYFRKKASDKQFTLASNLDVRISHFKRVIRLTGIISAAMLSILAPMVKSSLSLGYIPESYLPNMIVSGSILAFVSYGLYKAISAYRMLKRKRLIQE